MRVPAFAFLLAAPAVAGAQTASIDQTLDRALARYENVRTIRATFEQRLTNPMTGTTHIARGQTVQRRPGRIAITFTDPAGDKIVVDGKFIWVYTPSTTPGQVMRLPVGQTAGGGSPDLVSELLTEPRKRFVIADAGKRTAAGRTLHGLTLTPKPDTRAADMFATATVWIDSTGTVREFSMSDGNGLVRDVRFTKLSFNTNVPAKSFVFIVPKGVRVVDPANRS